MGQPDPPANAQAARGALPRLRRRQRLCAANPFRPFCSERCKNLDLGAWASESFRVPEKRRREEG